MRHKKYDKEITGRICDLIRKDSYTVAEICKMAGIAISTFYDWQESKPEFAEAIKKAREEFNEFLAVEAQKSLLKLVVGYEVEETKTTYIDDNTGQPKIKEQVVTKKHIRADTGAIIFTLTNKDPDNWKNRQNSEITGRGGKDLLPTSDMTREEIIAEIEKIRVKMNVGC